MKKITFTLFFLFVQIMAFAQLDKKYSKFLIFKSQAIDYYPVWGKTDQHIHLNLMSKEWRVYDLNKSVLQEGTYTMYPLGINNAENYTVVTSKKDIQNLGKNEDWKPREIVDKAGRKITLEVESFNAALYIEHEKGKKEKIMDIRGNAHSLAVSPSGKYLACIFEMSGLMIFDIEQEIDIIKKRLSQPIERFTKSTQKVEAKDLIGTWVAKSMDIVLDEKATKNDENEYRILKSTQENRTNIVKDNIKMEIFSEGTYKIETTFGGEKIEGKGTWNVKDGALEIKEESEIFRFSFSIDVLQNGLRMFMKPEQEKPFIATILLLKQN